MPKLIFRVNADTSPVKKFRTEIEQIEKTIIRIKGENFSFDHWVKEFERLKTELEKKREQIDIIKKDILSVNPITDRKKFDSLNTELSKSAKERDTLIDNTIALSNKFGKAYDDLVATLGKAQKVTDEVTARFIEQKQVVANLQSEVRSLNAEYRNADKGDKIGIRAQITSKQKELEQQRVTLNALKAEQERAKLAVKGLSDETRNYEKVVGKVSGAQAEANLVMGRFEQTLLKIGGLATLQRFASDVIRVRGEFQKTQVAFETMLGSKEKADKLMAQMVETAAKTPFDLQGVANGAKQLLAYGTEAKDVNDTLIRLGNIASGLSIPLGDMVYLYGTTQVQGRLFTQDVRQFTGRGIPLVKELASMLGKTEQEINKMVTAGQIGFPEVEKVIKKLTDEGGQFYNLMEKQSQTLSGQISNLGDAWDGMLNSIGENTQSLSSKTISMATVAVEHYEEIGRILIGLISTYGAYRAATIAYYAISKTYGVYDVATKELQFAATMKNIVATKAMTVQQALLNKTMLANPYILVTTLVVGAAAAMWILADHTSAAEKAQKRFNDEQEKFNKQQEERKQKIEELIRIIKDETETEYAKIKAYEELQQYSPALVAAYSREELATLELAKSQKVLNKERDNINYENIISNINRLTNQINEQNRKLRLGTNQGFLIQNKFNEDKSVLEQELNKYKKQLDEYNRLKKQAEEDAKPVKVKLLEAENNRDQIQAEFDKVNKKLEEEKEKLKNNPFYVIPFHIQIEFDNLQDKLAKAKDIVTQLLGGSAKPEIKNKSFWEKLKKDTQAQLEALSDVEAAGKKGLALKQKIAEYDKKINAFSTNTSSQESAAEKLRQQQEKYNLLLNKQALEQSRAAEDLENQTEQARINAMKEGNARTLEQMKLDHKKEMQQLDRQQEDLLRKKIEDAKAAFDAGEDKKVAKDSNYKRKIFDGSNISLSQSEKNAFDNQRMYLDLKQSGEMQAYLDKERQAWDEYLLEYSNFQEKKLALKRIYDDKIANATTAGEKASLKKEFETKDKELNLDEIKSSINFADIFGNLDAQSTDAIKTLRDKLKEIIEKSAKDLKPTDLKALQEALQSMDLKIAERDPFSELKNGLDNYKESAKAVEQAQKDLNTVTSGGEVIIGSYIDSTGKITKKLLTQEQAEKNLTDAQRKKKESQMQLTQSINSIGEKGQQVVQAGNDLVDMLTNLGIKIPESVTGALSGVGQIMDGLANIDITKPMSIVTGVTGMLAGLGKTIGSIFGLGGDSNTKKHFEDLKEQLDGINKIYEKIIENSKEKITFGEGFAAITAAADAMDTLNKKLENYRSLVRAGIEYKDGTKENAGWHSNKNVGAENFARMSKLVGKNITSVYDLANLGAEDLYTIMTKMPGAWGQMDEHVRTALEDIVECKDEAKELGDALGEAVTGVSFDSFYNGFIDQLADMEASSEEFADNFEGYLRKSIMASIVANNYKGQIEKLYNDWAKYGNDQIYSEDEIKDLRKQQEDITNAMLAERENLANTFGWENSSSSQEATKGSFQTMSQDTGTELNGRFTAFQASNEEIKNQSAIQSQSLNLLTAKADTILSVNTEVKNIADDTRDLIAQTYLELVQISENTGNSAKYLKDIKADIAEVKKNTSNL